MQQRSGYLAFFVAAGAATAPARASKMDWSRQAAEILSRYRALVQIGTSNPPGNETGR